MIRVVSWNIELARDIATAARELATLAELRDADIVLLQEMDPESTERLAAELGMASVYAAPATHAKTAKPFGNAVLSRWPMGEAVEVPLPGMARFQGQARSVVGATVTIGATPVSVFSVHLETVALQLRRRVEQAGAAASHIAQAIPHAAILGGDFNSASPRSIRAFDDVLSSADLKRVTNSTETFRRFRRPFALDHIYARNARSKATGVVGDATASDHLPIWAEVELTPPDP